MATYRDVKKQIAELEKQAEVLRKEEAARVIASIRSQIARYDLKPSDLFDGDVLSATASTHVPSLPDVSPSVTPSVVTSKAPVAKKPVSAAKYMDPVSRKTWNGHGKAPAWIKGGNREEFLIAKVQAALNTPAVKTKAVAKPAVKANVKTAAPKTQAKPVAKASAKPTAKPATKVAAKSPAAKAAPAAKPAAVAQAKPAPVAKKPAPAKKPAAKPKAAPAKKSAAKPKSIPVKTAEQTPPPPVAVETATTPEVAAAAVAGEASQA